MVSRDIATITILSVLLLQYKVFATGSQNTSSTWTPTSAPLLSFKSSSVSASPSLNPSLLPLSMTTAPRSSVPTSVSSNLSTFPTISPSHRLSFNPSVKPTNTPVTKPTVRPINKRPSLLPSYGTLRPTAATAVPIMTTLQLVFTQSLSLAVPRGCMALNADMKSQSALVQTTAQSLKIQLSDVTYASCEYSGSSAVSVPPVTANLCVNIPLADFATVIIPSNISSIISFYNKLQQRLTSSIQSGEFNTQLASISKYFNATLISKAVVSKTKASAMTVQNPPSLAPSTGPNSGGMDKKSSNVNDGSTSYIIIGIVAGIAFLFLSIAVCFTIFYIRISNMHSPSSLVVSRENPAASEGSPNGAFSGN